ncbi:MAG TPA: hypothetical protein VGX48_02875 [Pyrinomonadaceae bacterium]|jgi:NTP pyrophosphatase (non-canonical NTP hydrolase)|nr:hypothetical protein [Pyrinomonadaceae bacterium]
MRTLIRFTLLAALSLLASVSPHAQEQPEAYLSWGAEEAVEIGKAWRANGRVGGAFDMRVIHTEHAYNYKLRATLMTPEAIRAAARLEQLRLRLTDEQTRALVAEADAPSQLVAMVELDAREGSGVIPLDWRAALRPKGAGAAREVAGVNTPKLRHVKALAGVARRDYAYEVFWLVFPLASADGGPSLPPSTDAVELVVGIYNKEGRVSWRLPDSLRRRLQALSQPHK